MDSKPLAVSLAEVARLAQAAWRVVSLLLLSLSRHLASIQVSGIRVAQERGRGKGKADNPKDVERLARNEKKLEEAKLE